MTVQVVVAAVVTVVALVAIIVVGVSVMVAAGRADRHAGRK